MGIHIGGNASGNIIIQGDRNVTNTGPLVIQTGSGIMQVGGSNNAGLPNTIDIRLELANLRKLLSELKSEHRRKIDNAFDEAQAEASESQPDREELSKSLTRALDYARKAEGFVQIAGKIKPHLATVAAWLGSQYQHVADLIGS